MFRPNLHLEVWPAANEPEKRQHLTRLLAEIEGTGIVYAASVRQADLLHDLLAGVGFNVGKHHGRMPSRQRQESQDRFVAGEVHAIVGTTTFGTDVDKADVRFVIHYSVPASLESYHDEATRAGRDGKPARCALLYRPADRPTLLFSREGYPRASEVRTVYDSLRQNAAGEEGIPIAALKAAASSLSESELRRVLHLLKELEVVRERRGARIALLKPELSAGALDELTEQYTQWHAADHARLNRMVEYANSPGCRWKLLLAHLGQSVPWERCEHCDNCCNPTEDQRLASGAPIEAADG